jgi:sirohydrochlorin ferrochelatase
VTVAVLLAHGSPDPRSQASVLRAATDVASRSGVEVRAAFLDHDSRDLATAVASVDPRDDVVVLPLLLSTAFHARVDVPAAVATLDREVRLLEPVGHPAALLDDLLRRSARPAVVIAAGTRVDEERQAFVRAVAAASSRTRIPAVAAYATGPGRRLEGATRPGGSAVVPWLLAPGRLLDAVREAATAHGCRVVGDGLLSEALLLDELAARVTSARAASDSAVAGG